MTRPAPRHKARAGVRRTPSMARYPRGDAHVRAHHVHAHPHLRARLCVGPSARSFTIMPESGISTGHASSHAWHSVDPQGRSAPSVPPDSSGVSTLPIGPE